MVQILPTLLATSEQQYREQLEKVEKSGAFKNGWVQIDLMDNKFVPNKSIGLEIVAKYPISSKKEAQLMVIDPGEWIDQLINLNFLRIIFPIEVGNTKALIEAVKDKNTQVGLSLNPETAVSQVIPFLDKIDLVLMMGVHPGFQGQHFIPEVLDKIKDLVRLKVKKHFLIGADGGIKADNVKSLVEAGVDNLAIGSYLLNGDIGENLERLWEAIHG